MIRHPQVLPTLATLLALWLLAGCSTFNPVSIKVVPLGGAPQYPPTEPDIVAILHQEPSRPHAALAEIYAEPQGSPKPSAIADKLREAGAKLGADAVVIVADRQLVMGAIVTTTFAEQHILATPDHVIVGIAIRYLAGIGQP
jgi:hypothetical protein